MEPVSTNSSIRTTYHNGIIIVKIYNGIPPYMLNAPFKTEICIYKNQRQLRREVKQKRNLEKDLRIVWHNTDPMKHQNELKGFLSL